MARYIDADELKNTLVSSGAIGDFGQYLIEIQPAADVRPERHGEWVFIEDSIWECSKCGGGSFRNKPKYCPCCGAMMDGKEDKNKL